MGESDSRSKHCSQPRAPTTTTLALNRYGRTKKLANVNANSLAQNHRKLKSSAGTAPPSSSVVSKLGNVRGGGNPPTPNVPQSLLNRHWEIDKNRKQPSNNTGSNPVAITRAPSFNTVAPDRAGRPRKHTRTLIHNAKRPFACQPQTSTNARARLVFGSDVRESLFK